MYDVPNLLHFFHFEPEMTLEQAEYFVKWATHSPLYHVHVWMMNVDQTQCVPVLVQAIKNIARVHEIHYEDIEIHEGFRKKSIHPEIAPYPMSPLILKDIITLKSYFVSTIVREEVNFWENYPAARRLIRLEAIYKYGGIAFEPVIEPVGSPLHLGIWPPREVLFQIIEDDPPYCTDNVIAATPGSEKIRQIIDRQQQFYYEEYEYRGQNLVNTAEGRSRRAWLRGLKGRLEHIGRRGFRTRQDEREERELREEMYVGKLVRNLGRTGVTVFNDWLAENEGLEQRYEDLKEQREIGRYQAQIDRLFTDMGPTPIVPGTGGLAQQGGASNYGSIDDEYVVVSPSPTHSLPGAEYDLYSFENVFGFDLVINEARSRIRNKQGLEVSSRYEVVP